jgi:hypothetical protein
MVDMVGDWRGTSPAGLDVGKNVEGDGERTILNSPMPNWQIVPFFIVCVVQKR